MRLLTLAAAGWSLAAAAMVAVWAVQRQTKNAGVADALWPALVGGLAVFYAVEAHDGWPWRRLAIASMMGSWGARLAVHFLYDRVLGKAEERRYARVRGRQAGRADRVLFWMFQAHAASAVFFSVPALFASVNPADDFAPVELIAAALWTAAFSGETTADRQLFAFRMRAENQRRVCRSGLWRYSRHPNYFFEALIWTAFALFATGSPHGWFAWTCVAAMAALLLRVTGIPASEAEALELIGDDYRDYQRTTSAFLPLPPR